MQRHAPAARREVEREQEVREEVLQPYRKLLAVMADIGKLEDAGKPLPRQLVERVQQTLFQLRWQWSQDRYRAGKASGPGAVR